MPYYQIEHLAIIETYLENLGVRSIEFLKRGQGLVPHNILLQVDFPEVLEQDETLAKGLGLASIAIQQRQPCIRTHGTRRYMQTQSFSTPLPAAANMLNGPDKCPDVSVYYNYLFSLTEAAVDNTFSIGIPPHGYEDWASHSGRPRNLQEARNKLFKKGLCVEDANGDIQWIQGSQLPTYPSTPSARGPHYSPAYTPMQGPPSHTYPVADTHAAMRDNLDMMQRYHEYNHQILHEECECSHGDLMSHFLGNMSRFRGRNRLWHNKKQGQPYEKRVPTTKVENDDVLPSNPRRLTGKQLQDAIDRNRHKIDSARAEMERQKEQVSRKRVKKLEEELAKAKADLADDTTGGRIPDSLHKNANEYANLMRSLFRHIADSTGKLSNDCHRPHNNSRSTKPTCRVQQSPVVQHSTRRHNDIHSSQRYRRAATPTFQR